MIDVPLVDLAWQHRQVADRVREGFARVIERSSFIMGEEVAEFEQAFAGACGVAHALGVANGTDALELALRALGTGPGDEVIVPALTFAATALAVARTGATPVFADCDAEFMLIDPTDIAKRLSAKTRGIMPVHLYGQIAPVEDILAVAGEVPVLEDAAQAHGARRNGRGIGSWGIGAGVSFYPGKNLGAYGDAGAVLTNDSAFAARIRALRNYGGQRKYEHESPGFNSRLDTLQAVVLLANLEHLEDWNRRRRDAARRYEELLSDVEGVRLPAVAPGNEHVWHVYVVRVQNRDRILESLHESGIGAGVHYPQPLHLVGAFAGLSYRAGDFPNAEAAAREVLSLPLSPGIIPAQQERVVEALRKAL